MAREPIEILGAGLCGSLLAVMLARRGHPVTVREARPDPRTAKESAGRSINLALSARGIRGLEHAGVMEQVEPLLLPMRGRMIHETDGRTELLPYGAHAHEVINSVSRAGLNRLLIDVAEGDYGVDIRFGHVVAGYDIERAVVSIDGPDGEYELSARALLCADGAGSRIRRAYDEGGRIGPTESLLPHGYKELAIPPGPGGSFRLDEGALHIWPRSDFMLIALPNPGGDFTLTLFMPNDGDPGFSSLETETDAEALFETHFTDAAALIPNLGASFVANPVGILGTVRCRHWHDGDRFLLIGDAAHAIVPFHGQGMNLAFEDCVLLDELIGDSESPDWSSVFETFEHRQQPNANAIADMALENYVEMRDTVRDPRFALQKALAFELEKRLPRRFIARYSMVMFHDEIPYAVAQSRGSLQARLLQDLTADAERLEDVDLDAAATEVRRRLPPLDLSQ